LAVVFLFVELARERAAILEVPPPKTASGAALLNLVDEGREIGVPDIVPFEQHHVIALRLGVIVQSVGDIGRDLSFSWDDSDFLASDRSRQQIKRAGQ